MQENSTIPLGAAYSSCPVDRYRRPHRPYPAGWTPHKNNNNSSLGTVFNKLKKKKQPQRKDSHHRKRSHHGSSNVTPSQNWHFLLHDFTQSTTLHGIRYTTLETRFVFRRIFWWFIVGATLGIFIFYVWDRVGEYLEYKKNVSVEENYVSEMPFPLVTFCNQNSIRLTAAANNGWYGMVKQMFPEEKKVLRKCREEEEFSCKLRATNGYSDRTECIPMERRCDGFPDCSDESDELDCNPCPRLLLIGTMWNGTVFNIQHNTFDVYGPVYIGRTKTIQLIMYYNPHRSQGMWQLSDRVEGGQIYGLRGNMSREFPEVDWVWVHKGYQENFKFECFPYKKSDMTANDSMLVITDNAKKTAMTTLYTNGTHDRGVFIEKCLWKGQNCKPSYFKEVFTDMGKCYTFHADDMFVESSGAGHALTLTLNIEQYEYTKNPSTGVGIKVLFHEQQEEPLMAEKSVAISPGLYSLLAIEKQLTKNLKHPWGNCSEWPLKYYRKYTVSTCKMECDNVFARDNCQCRNAHMPKKQQKERRNDFPICTMNQYVTCLLPRLTEAKKGKDFCTCNTPCIEVVYVPSLSFAAISTDEDAIKSRQQEAKMADMQRRLTDAREITYRLAEDKYRETMRTFHMILSSSNNLVNFLEVADTLFEDEEVEVKKLYSVIEKQCKDFVSLLQNLESLIRSTLQPSLNNLQAVLQMLDFQITDYKHVLLNDTKSLLGSERELLRSIGRISDSDFVPAVDFSLPIDENTTVNFTVPAHWVSFEATSGDFDTLSYYLLFKTRTMTVLNSIYVVENTLLKHVQLTIANFPDISGIQISTDTQNYTISSIKKVLLSFIDVISEKCEAIRHFIRNSFKLKINDLFNNTETSYTTDKLELTDLIKQINSTIYTNIVVVLEEVKSVISSLSPKCEYESENLLQIYKESNGQIKNDLLSTKKQCNIFRDGLKQVMWRYIHQKKMLSTIAKSSGLLQYDADLQSKLLVIGNFLQQKKVSIKRLMQQNDVIKTKLLLYKQVLITETFQDALDTKVQKQSIHAPWLEMIANIETLQGFFELHIRNLTAVLRLGDKYLQSYVEGNVLNENFFKKNYLQLDLFYKSLMDKKVIQQKAYEYPALLSEVGGLMGLLLGASVITIFECIDLICYNGLVKILERRRPKEIRKNKHIPVKHMNNGDRCYPYNYVKRRGPLNVPIATFDPMDGLELSPNTSPVHKTKI